MQQPEYSKELLEEVAWFENWCRYHDLPLMRPNTMNHYGTILDTLGFGSFLHELMTEYIAPIAAREYADVGGDTLDGHHGFIVEYQVGKDVKLDFHVDASDVTLNVCLGGVRRRRAVFSGRALRTAPGNRLAKRGGLRNPSRTGPGHPPPGQPSARGASGDQRRAVQPDPVVQQQSLHPHV
jgi:hypothetical protein